MKKLYAIIVLLVAAIGLNAQCVIDSAAQPRPGISPNPDNLPCLIRSAAFDQTIQVKCPTTYDSVINFGITTYPLAVTVDSIEVDSVINLPTGISWNKNPYRLAGGANGCMEFTGTTTDTTGYYHLTWYGIAWVHAQYIGSRMVTGSLNRYGYVNYYLNVINAGDSCIPYNPYATTGISDLSPTLNALISVSPNPSNGVFTLKMNAGSRVNGQVEIVDVTGRIVYAHDIDLIGNENLNIDLSKCARGIYTLLVRTANGNATKRISID